MRMRERNELFVQSPCHFELRRTQKMTDHNPLYDVSQFRWRFIGSRMAFAIDGCLVIITIILSDK